MSRDQSPILPAKFAVVYRVRRCAGAVSDTGYPLVYVSTVNLSDLSPTDPVVPSILSGTAGVTRTVRDSAVALFNSATGAPSNLNNLKNLAKQYAQDWFDWATADQPGDIVVSGIVAPAPNGLIDTVEWAYAEGQCYTRIQSPPLNGAPDELSHFDPLTASCTDANNSNPAGAPVAKTPGIEFYSPPEFCTGGGATATATINSSGQLTGITLVSGGSTYTTAPTVCFSDDGVGTGAAATCTVTSGAVNPTFSGIVPGSGYNTAQPPIVSFNGGGTKLQRTRRRLFIEDGKIIARFISYDTIG